MAFRAPTFDKIDDIGFVRNIRTVGLMILRAAGKPPGTILPGSFGDWA